MSAGQVGAWRIEARKVIERVHASLPEGVTLAERTKAIDEAYPFGQRQYHPYKMWLIERRAYLGKHGYVGKSKKLIETPLERLMRRSTL